MTMVLLVDKDVTGTELKEQMANNAMVTSTPSEMLHAWLVSFARDINNGEDADILDTWRRISLSTAIQMKHLPGEDAQWASMQERENAEENFNNLRTTPLGRVLHICAFKKRREGASGRISVAQLVDEYQKGLKLAATSEKMSAGFIDMACTIQDRLLSLPRAKQLLLQAEDLPAGQNPLEGTTKLQAVISKARTPSSIELVVEAIFDMHAAGFMRTPPPVSAITGAGPASGGKGLVEIVLFKFDLLKWFLNDFMDGKAWGTNIKATLRNTFNDISSFRAACGYPFLKTGLNARTQNKRPANRRHRR